MLTSSSNYVVITYTLPKGPSSSLERCIGDDEKAPDLATIVVPMRQPSTFVDQALRAQWLGAGIGKGYHERADQHEVKRGGLPPPADGKDPLLYEFKARKQDRFTREAREILEEAGGAHEEADGMDGTGIELQPTGGPKSPTGKGKGKGKGMGKGKGKGESVKPQEFSPHLQNTVAVTFTQHVAILAARTKVQKERKQREAEELKEAQEQVGGGVAVEETKGEDADFAPVGVAASVEVSVENPPTERVVSAEVELEPVEAGYAGEAVVQEAQINPMMAASMNVGAKVVAAGEVEVEAGAPAGRPTGSAHMWTVMTDEASGNEYYFNPVTGVTQWDKPTE